MKGSRYRFFNSTLSKKKATSDILLVPSYPNQQPFYWPFTFHKPMKKPETQVSGQSRREFIKNAAIASSFFIVPRHVLGGSGFTSPSDQLNLAAIGAGGKGKSDIFNASVNGRERVIALCDVDFSGSAKDSVASFPKAKLYADYRKMLDEMKDIDAVTISTPDHVHGPAAK